MSGLSQSEVDALLAAVSDGEVGENSAGSQQDTATVTAANSQNQKNIQSYDLTSRDRVVRGRFPQLDVINEKFMRSFRVSLSAAVRKIASISIASTDFLKFGEFVNTLPLPTCMSVLKFQNLRGSGLFVIESKLAYALVDSFFGGTINRSYMRIEGKDFTAIELNIIKKVVDLAIADLEIAWESVEKIGASFVRTEVNPQFVGIVPPTDIVIATTFDVDIELTSGTMTLVLPYSTIEPIKQKLMSGFQVESDQSDQRLWSRIIQEQLLEAKVDLKVDLGETTLALGDVMKLKVGDVIPLTQDATDELVVQVEEVPFFKCYFGTYHGSIAAKVTRFFNEK
ncbi:MAG: flagellar motor switch protein FliM [Bdellovibrionaceae bacterium]|nr:flagellar motor switch protein FliM [Pseudobdellovibrionaceae bacterium]MDW8190847.1 flagellar motor switch protein FliM [Pseudobdellovibrionaceae bacterium]